MFFFDKDKWTLRRYRKIVDRINQLEPKFRSMTNLELVEFSKSLKASISKLEDLDEHLEEAFALVREVARRTLA